MLAFLQRFDSNIPLGFVNGVGDWKVQGSWYLFKARLHILGFNLMLVKSLNGIGRLFLDNWNLFLAVNRCGLDIFFLWLLTTRDIWLFKCWLLFALSFNLRRNLRLSKWSINFELLFLDNMLTFFQGLESNISFCFLNGVNDRKFQGCWYLFNTGFHLLRLDPMFYWDFKWWLHIIVLCKVVKSLNGIGRLFFDNWNLFPVLNRCGLDISIVRLLNRRDIWLVKCWLFFLLSFIVRRNLGLCNWSINFGLLFLDNMLTFFQGLESNIPFRFLNGVNDRKFQGCWYLFDTGFHLLRLNPMFYWDLKWWVHIIVLCKFVKSLNGIGSLFLHNWSLFLFFSRCGLDIFILRLLNRRDICLFKCWLFFVLSFNRRKNLGLRNWSINFGLLFLDDMLTFLQGFDSIIPLGFVNGVGD
ncbi:hypothetical protein BDL97_17G087200 [Sphagnum fallax]|nr:hypothetical protein BDL97_17G087200 [Sphagnum fallax]